eukprot:scaffold5615_cov103-Isochrysis_galbana.AAC.3
MLSLSLYRVLVLRRGRGGECFGGASGFPVVAFAFGFGRPGAQDSTCYRQTTATAGRARPVEIAKKKAHSSLEERPSAERRLRWPMTKSNVRAVVRLILRPREPLGHASAHPTTDRHQPNTQPLIAARHRAVLSTCAQPTPHFALGTSLAAMRVNVCPAVHELAGGTTAGDPITAAS